MQSYLQFLLKKGTNYGFTKQTKKETIIKKYWKKSFYRERKGYGKSLGDERDRESKSGDERGRS